ncbi:MAG: glycosyltransferase family 2 protein, partial [Planctomycetota bacterium]|nr:glycosyltransferase family 2 protein [Planctomycetota bacterium]
FASTGILGVLFWCFYWIRAWYHFQLYRSIPRQTGHDLDSTTAVPSLPSLTVIVPACNEGETIEAAAQSLLAQDYPALEFIFINDRSEDDTGNIIDRLAESDSRIKPVHITTLPEGWLGKVHALHVATTQAQGEWLLYTDADVCFEPNALQEIVTYALNEDIDHLAGLPKIRPANFALEVAIATFFSLSMFFVSPKRVADPNDPLAVGVGALNLVRRSTLENSDGFPWLKMETVDDLGLGLLLKRSGARTQAVLAKSQLSLGWYNRLGEMAKGLEKNSPALTRYSFWRAVGLWSIFPLALTSLLGLLALPGTAAILLITVGAVFSWVAGQAMTRKTSFSPISFLLSPFGFILLWLIFCRAISLLWWRAGVDWRGTHYPLSSLKHGRRIEI